MRSFPAGMLCSPSHLQCALLHEEGISNRAMLCDLTSTLCLQMVHFFNTSNSEKLFSLHVSTKFSVVITYDRFLQILLEKCERKLIV